MKKTRLLNYLFLVFFVDQLMSFKKPDDRLSQVFNRTELKTIWKIIHYFDDFMLSQTDHQFVADQRSHSAKKTGKCLNRDLWDYMVIRKISEPGFKGLLGLIGLKE